MTAIVLAFVFGFMVSTPVSVAVFCWVVHKLAIYEAPEVSHRFGDAP